MHLTANLSDHNKLIHRYAPYTHDTDNRQAVTCEINGEQVVPVFTTRQACDDWIDANLIPADYRVGVDAYLRRNTYGITADYVGPLGIGHVDSIGFAWM